MNATISQPSFAALTRPYQMPLGRVLRAYLSEARYQFVQALRAPAFALPFLLLPVPLYLFFGVVMAGGSPEVQANPGLANYVFSGRRCMAVMGPAIFGIGIGIAMERDANLLKLKRALPLPPGSYLVAKMLMSIAFAALAVGTVTVMALVAGKLTLSAGALLAMVGVLVFGAVPFARSVSSSVRSRVECVASVREPRLPPRNGLSGMFFPLPKVMEPWEVIGLRIT